MKAFRNFINGEWVDAASGETSAVIDPSTGEQYAEAALSGQADVDAAMSAASAAYEGWSNATPSDRALALIRVADAIEAAGDE
ncbi:MAG: aldehyde dehydrogenase family protein, partial [Ilumatobacter fluminis]